MANNNVFFSKGIDYINMTDEQLEYIIKQKLQYQYNAYIISRLNNIEFHEV